MFALEKAGTFLLASNDLVSFHALDTSPCRQAAMCYIQVSNEASLSAFRADKQYRLIGRGWCDGFLAADRAHTEGTQDRKHQYSGD